MPYFKYTLSLVTIMEYKDLNVVEWIEYHKHVGVDHFYIYDNNKNSGLSLLLDYYVKNNIVTLIYYPGNDMTLKAYNNAVKEYKGETKYMCFMNINEFLVSEKHDRLADIVDRLYEGLDTLRPYAPTGCICINYRVFNADNYEIKPKGLVIENYTKFIPIEDNYNINSIINPRAVDRIDIPNFPKFIYGYVAKMQYGSIITEPLCRDIYYRPMRIHRYIYISTNSESDNIVEDKFLTNYAIAVRHNMIEHGYNPDNGEKL